MLALPEHLTLRNAQDVLRALQADIAASRDAVCVDAAAVRQVDSAALAVLLACKRSAQAKRLAFEVSNMPPRLRDLADLYGVQELLEAPPAVG